jgi:hypothetical protein
MGRNTPQRNHLADIAFLVLSNQGQAMMENSKILKNRNYLSWREAFNTSTKLDGFVEVDGITMRRYWHPRSFRVPTTQDIKGLNRCTLKP